MSYTFIDLALDDVVESYVKTKLHIERIAIWEH